ncbi:MAG TPA: hypothetical protein VNL71_16480, partial [Chloroflexota bacterium]|nr:hypothetical protein [Chloroflexota bacterium]
MPLPVSLLYAACLLALPILAIFVLSRRPASRLHRLFFWGALALFGWLLTLFVFDGARDPQRLLALGRLNFAFSQAAVLFGYLFVARLSARPGRRTALLVLETLALAAVTLATPLIDRRELVLGGVHVTRFGPLFPWHAAHMLLYPAATASTAFRAARAASRRLRSQLEWVGAGRGGVGKHQERPA